MSAVAATPFAPTFVRVPQPKRWTVEEFHRICGEPTFRNHQFMLIAGEILEMPIPNPPHTTGLGLAEDVLRSVFGTGFWVRSQMPLVLGVSTDPMPDLAVVHGSPRDYSTAHPRTAMFVVEISDS